MRRIALALALVGLLVPAVIATSPPAAAASVMSGRIERVAVVFDEGPRLEIYGWSKDLRERYSNNNVVRVTVNGPDGRPVATDFEQPLLSTQSFTNGVNDHPDRDPMFGNTVHHGFWTMAEVSKPGRYTVCAKAAPGHPSPTAASWTSLGCSEATVPVRGINGGLTSVGADAGSSGLHIEGWAADSWDRTGVSADIDISWEGPPEVPAGARPVPGFFGMLASTPPSRELAAQHPGTVGLRGWSAVIDPAPPGAYTVCASFRDDSGLSAPRKCMTTTVTAAYVIRDLQAPAGNTLAVGQKVSMTPASWAPAGATVVDRLVLGGPSRWTEGVDLARGVLATAAPGGALLVPASVAGRRICLVETATVAGGIPMSQYFCYQAVVDATVTRAAGVDRYATAAAISRAAFPSSGPRTVYIASGTSFADALSAGPVVAKNGSALLLTGASALPAATKAELLRLRPANVVIVGGTGVVSNVVLSQLRALVPSVTRIGGADRYATSRAVIASAYGAGAAPRVLVATGRDFPDALSAVPAARTLSAPILLVDGRSRQADGATLATLKRLGAKRVTVLGGTGAVSTGVASSLGAGISVDRASGIDRYATSIAVSRLAAPGTTEHAYIASGGAFPDALAAASLQKKAPGPLYLSSAHCVPAGSITDLVRTRAQSVTLLGGNGALSFDALVACAP